jgi:hypothetical protein
VVRRGRPDAEVFAELRERVHCIELERAAERQRTGGRVLGRRAVLAQSWRDQPGSPEPRRNLRPRIATPNKWARVEVLLRDRSFVLESWRHCRGLIREAMAGATSQGCGERRIVPNATFANSQN